MLSDISMKKEDFVKIQSKTQWNARLSEFYDQLEEDTGYHRYADRSHNIKLCCRFAKVDYYRMQRTKDIKEVYTCKDRFCVYCQSSLAARREQKYKPMLDEYAQYYDIYHLTMTVKNPFRDDLRSTVFKMFKKFKYFTRFLSGDKKIKGISFEDYGYVGLIRSLEITLCSDTSFHPHFHCMVLFRKGLKLSGAHKNQFSYKEGDACPYLFTDFEILIQKIWYLLMNDIEVTKDSIEALHQGYSCMLQRVDHGDYHEVFKYVLKGLLDSDGFFLEYDDFVALERAFFRRHIIQGYGLLWKVQEDPTLDEEVDELYEEEVARLKRFEDPVVFLVYGGVDEMLSDPVCTYISRSSIRRSLLVFRDGLKSCEKLE